jgi:hypothetical protein
MWQLDVIMICVLLLAVRPLREVYTEVRNWLERQEAHRRSQQ